MLAIGSPFGLDQTVTAGIISARDREANEISNQATFKQFLQTDAAINRGNSGGPLINLAGEVIGINSAIATSTGDYNGICFALPSNEAIAIYRQLKSGGRVVRGFLGIVSDPVTPQIAQVFGLRSTRGAIVSAVTDTYVEGGRQIPTPAAKAGLQVGDIITDFRGDQIRHSQDLLRKIAATPVGVEVPIRVIRDGREASVRAVMARRPTTSLDEETYAAGVRSSTDPPKSLGIDVVLPTGAAQKAFDASGVTGVVVITR